jgi:hypothetical protein
VATIWWREQLFPLQATAIWAAVEKRRRCLLSLPVDSAGNPRIADSSEACGGPSRLSIYTNTSSITAYPVPTAQTTNLPGNWQYSGCLAYVGFLYFWDLPRARCSLWSIVRMVPLRFYRIKSSSPRTTRPRTVFHYAHSSVILLRVWNIAMSAVSHLPRCGAFKMWLTWTLLFLGCGDVADITNNGGTTAPETDCNMACSGDPIHLCGGGRRLQLYLWNGVLNNWQTPTNIGQYQVRVFSPFIFVRMCTKRLFYVVSHSRTCTSAACLCRNKRQGHLPGEKRLIRVRKLYWRIRTRLESRQRFQSCLARNAPPDGRFLFRRGRSSRQGRSSPQCWWLVIGINVRYPTLCS